MHDDEAQRSRFDAMLADLEARDMADSLNRAIGWTVLSQDDEHPDAPPMVIGFFLNVGDALRYAYQYGVEVNLDSEDGKGWTVSTQPVMPSDPIPMFAGTTDADETGGRSMPAVLDYGEGKTPAQDARDSAVMLGGVLIYCFLVLIGLAAVIAGVAL